MACTINKTRNATKRLEVVIVKISEPNKKKNAPTEATILIAWSAKNSLHENTRRGGSGRIGGGVAAGFSESDICELTGDGATLTSSGTCGKEGVATMGATGGCAPPATGRTVGEMNVLYWRNAFKRN